MCVCVCLFVRACVFVCVCVGVRACTHRTANDRAAGTEIITMRRGKSLYALGAHEDL